MARLTITNKIRSEGFGLADRSTYFGFTKSGDFVAGAHGNPSATGAALGSVGGATVDDVSDPDNIVRIFAKKMVLEDRTENNNPTCRAVFIEGTPKTAGAKLWCCTRRGDEADGAFGDHDGANNAAVLTDTSQSWTVNEFAGDLVVNLTDGSQATIISNTSNTITATLAGGTDNDWDIGDEYDVETQSGSLLFAFNASSTDPNDWDIFPVVDVGEGDWAGNHFAIHSHVSDNDGSKSIPMFSDMAYDPVNGRVNVFSQISGVFQFTLTDVSTVTNTNNDHSIGGFENQGGTVLTNGPSVGQVWSANYRFGMRVLNPDLTDLAASAGIIAPDVQESTNIRVWDCTPDDTGQFIFAAATANGTEGQTNPSGFQVYDARTPSAPALIDTYLLPESDRDTWNGARDPACLRISQVDGFVFVSNMGKGYAVWDCRDPLNPVYRGTYPNSLQTAGTGVDTVSGNVAWRDGEDYYIAYGDGYQPNGLAGTKQRYVDQVEGLKVSTDYIGNFRPTGTGFGTTVGVSSATTRSMQTNEGNGPRIYGPVIGTETLLEVGAFAGDGVAGEDLIFGVYEAVSSTDGTPKNSPLFGPDTVPVITAPFAERTLVVAHSLAAHVGKFLTMAVTAGSGDNISIEREATLQSNSRSDPGGTLPAPWAETSTNGHDMAMWYEVSIPQGGPALTGPLTFDLTFPLTFPLTG